MSIGTILGYYRVAIFYYIVGGLTFIPLCAALLFGYFYLSAPVCHFEERTDPSKGRKEPLGDVEFSEERKREALDLAVSNAEAQRQAEREKGQEESIGSSTAPSSAKRLMPPPRTPIAKPHRAGWLVVRRQFQSEADILSQQTTASQEASSSSSVLDANGAPSSNRDSEKGPGYMSSLYKGMLKYRGGRSKEQVRPLAADGVQSGASTPDSGADDKASVRIADISPIRASPGQPKQAAGTGGKESFYCILKGPVLYLYSSDDTSNSKTECHAAIDLRSKRVSLYISGIGDTIGEPDEAEADEIARSKEAYDTDSSAMSEGEEVKDSIARSNWRKAKRAAVRDGELFTKRNAIRIVSMSSTTRADQKHKYAQWFIFCRNATYLEDWYHALLHASLDQDDPIGPSFSPIDMVSLLGSLDSLPDPIPLRWLNALVGRVFFSIYRTAWLEDYVTRKIMRKISRVKTPSFLSDIRVREVDLGRSAPAFSRPMLKSLTGEGEASMEVAVHYTGAVRLTISTVLTISLGSRFKPYNVPLILAVIINSLEGNLLLQIKPPPSNRIWYAFTKLPKMEISVEPVVSERKVQWGMVKKLIESRIRELLTESLVMPNMDDLSFFDSRPLAYRGGIWADASKRPDKPSTTHAEDETTAEENVVEPKSKSTPASMMNVALDDPEEKADTTALDNEFAAKMKRRKPVVGIEEGEATATPSSLSSSPAAAGLSTLLARDLAREPAQNGQTDSIDASKDGRTSSSNPNRRSWFAPRSNTAMPTTSTNNLASAAAASAKDSRSNTRHQSSLAWGSASLSRPSVSEKSAEIPVDTPTQDVARDRTVSVSSIGGDSVVSAASADTEELHSRLAAALEGKIDAAEEISPIMQQSDAIPTVTLQGSEETIPGRESPLDDVGNGVPISLSPDQQSINEEGGSDTKSVKSSLSPIDTAGPNMLPPPPRRTPSHGFAPPPMRSSTVRQPSKDPSPTSSVYREIERGTSSNSAAAAHLSALQRDRYGLSPRGTMSSIGQQDDNSSIRSGNLSTTSLMNTWNKAKASMADKDSRQVAAKEAKDALKRGWANWNAKRGGASGSVDANLLEHHLPTSSERERQGYEEAAAAKGNQSHDREVGRPSSWLASSPPDPASLGVGFDITPRTESPMPTFDLDEDIAKARDGVAARERQESSNSATSSRASSTSGRAAYREHRASKEKEQHKQAPPSNSLKEADMNFIPPAPMPTAKKTSSAEAYSRDNAKTSLSASPSSIRKWSASASGNTDGQDSLGYSFAPSQGQATIGLTRPDLASMFDKSKDGKTAPASTSAPESEAVIDTRPSADGDTTITATDSLQTPADDSEEQTRRLSSSSNSSTVGPSHSTNPNSSSPRLRSESYLDTHTASSSPNSSTQGIKRQPARATMMAIPGIPSNQKTGPQSFSAAPVEATKENNGSPQPRFPPSPRLGLGPLFARIPPFGSASSATAPANSADSAGQTQIAGSSIMASNRGAGDREDQITMREGQSLDDEKVDKVQLTTPSKADAALETGTVDSLEPVVEQTKSSELVSSGTNKLSDE